MKATTVVFGILMHNWFCIKTGFFPTLKEVIARPSLLLSPTEISRIFMAKLWARGFGDGIDEAGRSTKEHLITPNAYGSVLDLGAGHGHTVRYLDHAKVTQYIALEPNVNMHPLLRKAAFDAGYRESDGSFVLLACGAEETTKILAALDSKPVDTIISVLTLCSVPGPQKAIHNLVRDVLVPGGLFLLYEHVLSHRSDVAWWQRFCTPLWVYVMDGCRLDCPTDIYCADLEVEDDNGVLSSPWKEKELWGQVDEPEEHLLWHQVGKFVKN
ncbi:S-adenosyl-L-methionine-dependent methyltransferase [Ephemerocybe angulata]|uniref:S-adenosyl-L-methionine-dependent methyltransferase n=1 Tax=Ephemerocybe angulata TaxID=980116 RepID=A0A8H6HIU6_9AGAR|nr:S-adenosyl-L-methionine-dependent methyltransferase [Tulosesus angulatus]